MGSERRDRGDLYGYTTEGTVITYGDFYDLIDRTADLATRTTVAVPAEGTVKDEGTEELTNG